jgi:hypothetical protein
VPAYENVKRTLNKDLTVLLYEGLNWIRKTVGRDQLQAVVNSEPYDHIGGRRYLDHMSDCQIPKDDHKDKAQRGFL